MFLYAIASPFVTVGTLVLFSPNILFPPPIIELDPLVSLKSSINAPQLS